MFKFRKTFGLVLFLTSFQLSLHAKAAEIISVFPTGSVKQVQQVVVKFSTDMVALGDPRSFHDPMNVTCVTGRKKTSPSFKTRWVDTKAWSLDFDHALASGTQCKLVLAEIKDLKGDRVVSKESYSFSTGGPAILSISPQYGEIEPEQYFLVQTDGAIDVKSVESLGYFEAETIPDRIGVVVLKSEQQREEIIRAEVAHQWRWNELRPYLKIKKPIAQIPEFKNFIVLKANRRFPEDHQISLHWPQGILSPSGVAVSEAQTFEFRTRLPFSVQMTCERVAPGRPCNPIQNIRLQFTSRISIKALQNVKIVSDKKQVFEPLEIQSGDSNENSSGAIRTHRKSRVSYRVIRNFNDDEVDTLTFSAPFPERSKFKVMIPKGIKDELGRALVNEDKFPLDIETDEYLPLIKFSGAFGLLELKAEPALPVSVRNIEKQMLGSEKTIEGRSLALTSSSKAKDVIDWYNKVLRKEDAYNERNIPLLQPADGQNISLPKPLGERDFELVGIPFKKPGFYVVELQSPKLGQALLGAGTMYVASSALVTNLSVHFKKGRESSLVWVTSLDSAKPVKDAEVGIYDGEGNLLSKSKTDASGIAKFGTVNYPCGFQLQTDDDHDQGSHHQYGRACEVYAFAKKDEDFSFVSSQWAKGIEEYRFNLSREYLAPRWGPAIAHTILDRSLFRAGETVRMKHILREYGSEALRGLNPKALPKRVLIRHNGTQKPFNLPFHFISASGTALNDFAIPKDAPLGTYSIFLSNKKDAPKQKEDGDEIYDYTSKSTGEFTVSEFRLPLMQANVKIQGDHLIQPKEVKADLSASYLSGGPAAGLFVKLRSIITPGYFTPEIAGGSDYTFFSDPVKTGLVDAEAGIDHDEQNLLKVQDLKLRPDGGVLAVIGHFPKIQKISKLKIEMEFRDPNGETKTASAYKNLFQ